MKMSNLNAKDNYFYILRLPQQAYKQLVLTCHSDKNPNCLPYGYQMEAHDERIANTLSFPLLYCLFTFCKHIQTNITSWNFSGVVSSSVLKLGGCL